MRKGNTLFLIGLTLLLSLILTACGSEAATSTPEPTDTPAPTNTPAPTATPEPTVDLSSLPADDLWATVEALETELAKEEEYLASASGAEGASVQTTINQLTADLEELRPIAEAAGPRDEGNGEEDTTENTETTEGLTLSGNFGEARVWSLVELVELDMITATVAGPTGR
jgi:hypothetical protein